MRQRRLIGASGRPLNFTVRAQLMASSQEIYVALLNEGTEVWRPVQARALGGGEFEILGIVPAGELWQFPPGTRVRCKEHHFADGIAALRAYEKVAL
jgi:hypothetical protein